MLTDPKDQHQFKPNSTFENAFRIYCFDRELKKLVLSELEKIEVAIRAKMVHILSMRHGGFWFNDAALFKKQPILSRSISKFTDEFNKSDEQFIRSFKEKYSDPLPPSWMALEISSFGNLSYLYNNLKAVGGSKRDIANEFGLDEKTFSSWIHTIVYLRNVCAHHSRLWNKVMGIAPKIPATPAKKWITVPTAFNQTTDQMEPVNNRVYFILSMLIYLLNTVNPQHTFKNRFQNLLRKYPNIDERAMGFPANWKSEPLWVINQPSWRQKIVNFFALKYASKHILR